MGQGVKTGLGHGGITCVLQTQFPNFFFFFFFEGGMGEQGNMAIYLNGSLENKSLFLGNKTDVRECLEIIFRNKTDHKKNLCLLNPFPPNYIPPTQHILWHFLEIIIHFWSYCYKKKSRFFRLRSSVRKCMQKYSPAYLPISKYRVGVLQILNLKNDPLLENIVNYFQ